MGETAQFILLLYKTDHHPRTTGTVTENRKQFLETEHRPSLPSLLSFHSHWLRNQECTTSHDILFFFSLCHLMFIFLSKNPIQAFISMFYIPFILELIRQVTLLFMNTVRQAWLFVIFYIKFPVWIAKLVRLRVCVGLLPVFDVLLYLNISCLKVLSF